MGTYGSTAVASTIFVYVRDRLKLRATGAVRSITPEHAEAFRSVQARLLVPSVDQTAADVLYI